MMIIDAVVIGTVSSETRCDPLRDPLRGLSASLAPSPRLSPPPHLFSVPPSRYYSNFRGGEDTLYWDTLGSNCSKENCLSNFKPLVSISLYIHVPLSPSVPQPLPVPPEWLVMLVIIVKHTRTPPGQAVPNIQNIWKQHIICQRISSEQETSSWGSRAGDISQTSCPIVSRRQVRRCGRSIIYDMCTYLYIYIYIYTHTLYNISLSLYRYT